MGDRVYCTVTVLMEHRDIVKDLIDNEQGEPEDEDDDGETITLTYSEVNYGNIDCLKQIHEQGIPYDFHWEHGGGFAAGMNYVRFTETGEVRITVTDGDGDVTMTCDEIAAMLKKHSPESLVDALQAWVDENQILPWDNQAEYGKRYRARQLISA